MNDNHEKTQDTYRSFLLLSEIAGEEPLSQREISRRLGIAVGLVNSYLKNLVAKGYVRVKNFPSNRYAYLLTPQGLVEKSRLTNQHLSYFTGLYTVARQDYLALFQRLETAGIREVIFCGVDEVAEIAYLSLKETRITLKMVMDSEATDRDFFENKILPIAFQGTERDLAIIITSMKRSEQLKERLQELGTDNSMVFTINNVC